VRKHSLARCPDASEVSTSLSKTHFVVRATAHGIGIVFVLAVVLPEAHRADVIPTALRKSHEPAAGTRVRPTVLRPGDVLEGHAPFCAQNCRSPHSRNTRNAPECEHRSSTPERLPSRPGAEHRTALLVPGRRFPVRLIDGSGRARRRRGVPERAKRSGRHIPQVPA
jgi:hypothetical protein